MSNRKKMLLIISMLVVAILGILIFLSTNNENTNTKEKDDVNNTITDKDNNDEDTVIEDDKNRVVEDDNNDEDTITEDDDKYSIVIKNDFRELLEETSTYITTTSYVGNNNALNDIFNDYIGTDNHYKLTINLDDETIRELNMKLNDSYEKTLTNLKELEADESIDKDNPPIADLLQYKVIESDNYLSIFEITHYLGGTCFGSTINNVYVIDLKAEKVLSEEDLVNIFTYDVKNDENVLLHNKDQFEESEYAEFLFMNFMFINKEDNLSVTVDLMGYQCYPPISTEYLIVK